jgi:predicted transcriptional regulator
MSLAPTHPVIIKIDSDTRERVKKLSDAREQFRQDAISAWQEYQATGLHVTQQAADDWLTKLAAGVDEAIPACHV